MKSFASRLICGFLCVTGSAHLFAADALGFDAYYDIKSAGARSPASELAITRQSSCAIQLKSIVFEEMQSGNFVPHLRITFRNQLPNGTLVDVHTVAVLFDNAISEVGPRGVINFRLNNQALATGINLSKVTIVNVELRLHRVKDQFKELSQILKPLLNTVQGGAQSIVILDNLMAKVQDGPVAPKIFSADFLVAGNILEYEKMSAILDDAFLKNNQEYLIPMQGVTTATDTSLRGMVNDLINLGAKALNNSRVVDPATVNLKGYASLVFSKDRVPLLPEDLEGRLREVSRQLTRGSFDRNSFRVAADSAESTAVYLENTKIIDSRVSNTVLEYITLARIYAAQRSGAPEEAWDVQFSDWLVGFRIRLATLSAQSIGVSGLYSAENNVERLAPVFLPYFLPDDLLASFQSWQILLHRSMKLKNNFSTAVPRKSA